MPSQLRTSNLWETLLFPPFLERLLLQSHRSHFFLSPKGFKQAVLLAGMTIPELPLLLFSCFSSNGQGCGTKPDLLTEDQCISSLRVCKELGLVREVKRKQCKRAEGLGSLAASSAFTPADFKYLWRHKKIRELILRTSESGFVGEEEGRLV